MCGSWMVAKQLFIRACQVKYYCEWKMSSYMCIPSERAGVVSKLLNWKLEWFRRVCRVDFLFDWSLFLVVKRFRDRADDGNYGTVFFLGTSYTEQKREIWCIVYFVVILLLYKIIPMMQYCKCWEILSYTVRRIW